MDTREQIANILGKHSYDGASNMYLGYDPVVSISNEKLIKDIESLLAEAKREVLGEFVEWTFGKNFVSYLDICAARNKYLESLKSNSLTPSSTALKDGK